MLNNVFMIIKNMYVNMIINAIGVRYYLSYVKAVNGNSLICDNYISLPTN